MPRSARLSYQKLKQDSGLFDEEGETSHSHGYGYSRREHPRARSGRRLGRRRWKIRIPRLRRFFKKKRRLVWGSWAKVVRRLKDSQAHFGDLFAGNYLFLQVTPDSLKFKTDRPHPPPPVVAKKCYVPSLPSLRFF